MSYILKCGGIGMVHIHSLVIWHEEIIAVERGTYLDRGILVITLLSVVGNMEGRFVT